MSGRSDDADELLRLAETDVVAGSMSDLNRLVAHVGSSLANRRVNDAMILLLDQIGNVAFGVPGRESTYIALFAWARHLIADRRRAVELIEHTVKRMPQDYLLTCHVKSIIDKWPSEEFHTRSISFPR